MLISANADVNAEVSPGWTPLNSSRSSRDAEVVALIVDLLIAAGGHWGTVCRDGNVVNPDPAAGGISNDSPPHCVCPAPNVKTTSGACEPESTCDSPAVLNAGTNRCDCPASHVGENGAEEPGICGVVSAEFCGNLKPGRFYAATLSACVPFVTCAAPSFLNPETNRCDCPEPYVGTNLGACEIVATCAAPLVLNAGTNRCDCPAPHVGTDGGECVAASAEVCGELNPPQFYDAALSACVPIVTSCDSDEEVVYPEGNDCHAESDYPLHEAARAGDLDLVNHFIFAHQASVNVKDNFGRLPLILAVETANASVVAALIAAGADVNVKDRNDLTPLYSAAARGYAAVVATLVALGVDVNLKTAFGSTPLHIAAYNGRVAAVAALIALDADVNAKTAPGAGPLNGATPLNWAASNKMTVVYPALIAAGGHWGEACAEPTSVNSAGPDPSCVSAAVCGGLNPPQFYDAALPTCVPYVECASGEVVYPDANVSPEVLYAGVNDCHVRFGLHAAAEAPAELDIVNHFITVHKADVNLKVGPNGNTPLLNAAWRGHVSIVAALLAAGANVSLKNKAGETPLHRAASAGHPSVVALLISADADVNAAFGSNSNHTPLVFSTFHSDAEVVALIVDLLIAAGGHWGTVCRDGNVVNPDPAAGGISSDSPPHCVCPAPNVKTTSGACEPESTCDSPAVLNAGTNRCDCLAPNVGRSGAEAPGDCLTPAAAACMANEPPQFYSETDSACVDFVVCDAPSERNDRTNLCDCSAPYYGMSGVDAPGGDCALAGKEVCERLGQFYDAALSACVPLVECASGEVVYKDVNDCHAADGLFAAVKAGDLDLVHHFITVHMADVNSKDRHQWALLHFAAGRGHIPVVTALISLGADVNVRNDSGQRPLHRAVNNDLVSVVATLIALGADVNAESYRQKGGRTPLTYTRGRIGPDVADIIALLIANGGHWGTVCKNGKVANPTGDLPDCVCPSSLPVATDLGVCEAVVATCDLPSVLNAKTNRCDCPAPGVGTDGADAPGVCACPVGHGVYEGACASCPSDRITAGGMCVIPPAVTAAANATLLAEVRKSEPDLAVVRRALDLKANPNITTSAGIPVLVVAATMLHADVVSVLITAGANPSVKVDGVSDATYNRNGFPRFIPEALMERGLLAPPADGGRRLAETFVRFGDAAGGGFDWRAASLGGERTGDLAFVLADALLQTVYLNAGATSGARPLDAVLQYLLERGADCGPKYFITDATNVPDSLACVPFAACAAPSIFNAGTNLCDCPALHDGLNGAEAPGVCACPIGWSLENGTCVPSPVVAAVANATLLAEVSKTWPESPDLAVVRRALTFGASPNITTSAGVPVLVAAALGLHAEAVSVLITAGADPLVKVAGIFEGNAGYNPRTLSAFIPGALAERAFLDRKTRAKFPIGRRLAEAIIHFGDAAGDQFDWGAVDRSGPSRAGKIFTYTAGELVLGYLQISRLLPRRTLTADQIVFFNAIGRYVRARGESCPASWYGAGVGGHHPSYCAARRVCSSQASGEAYSCSRECDGFPLLARNSANVGHGGAATSGGGTCVSACGENEHAVAADWPDSQCQCAHEGEVGGNGCPSEFDAALISEALKPKPNLATIRALLDQGANPNAISNGVPLLVVAATLLHADVVSVLITAGADPLAEVAGIAHTIYNPSGASRSIPEGLLELGFHGRAPVSLRMAETFASFGDAAGDSFWMNDARNRRLFGLLDGLRRRAEAEPDFEASHLRTMARYLLSRGASCPAANQYTSESIPSDALCACPSGTGFLDGACVACPAGRILDNGECKIDAAAAANMALAAEIQKTSPSLSTVRAALDAGANPDLTVNGRPALIEAGRRGHAKVVSVLVTAGADVNAADAGFDDFGVAHHAAAPLSGANAGDAAGPRALRASVLFYFGGGLDARKAADAGADFDWNREDANDRRPLDLLVLAASLAAEQSSSPEEDAAVIRQMADYMVARGASCGDATTDRENIICVGPVRRALLEEVKKPRGAANITTVLRLLGGNNADPDAQDLDGTPILLVAATIGHAEIVSVLITAGADPDARIPSACGGVDDGDSFGLPHLTARNNFGSTLYYTWGTALNVLRHFADAVNQVGASYDWNARGVPADCSPGARAIDYLRPRYEAGAASLPEEGIGDKLAAMGRMADILIANGASCSSADQIVKNHVTCFGVAREALLSAGDANEARLLLEEDSVHPNIKDKEGRPILIRAAIRGRFEVVSVLITAGADPQARWNGDAVPHLVMRNNFNQPSDRLYYGWSQAEGVLQYFVDAVNDTPGATYDWEATNSDNQRAVELADYRYNHSLAFVPKTGGGWTEREDWKKSRILNMVDMLLAQGDSCRPEHTMGWHNSVTCVGSASQALLDELKRPRVNVAKFLRLLDGRGVSPDVEYPDGTPILIAAATLGHAEIVGALITAGANPEARLRSSICAGASIGRAVPHLTAQNNFNPLAPAQSSLYYTWGTALTCFAAFCRRGESGRRVLRLERRRRGSGLRRRVQRPRAGLFAAPLRHRRRVRAGGKRRRQASGDGADGGHFGGQRLLLRETGQ